MTDQPFNVAACDAGPCHVAGTGLDVMSRLGAAVRRCPQGVLIRTGCLLRMPRCTADVPHDSGCHVLVQPCDAHRRPRGPAIAVGPVLTRGDVESVAAWLTDGDLDCDRLDLRLRPRTARHHRGSS